MREALYVARKQLRLFLFFPGMEGWAKELINSVRMRKVLRDYTCLKLEKESLHVRQLRLCCLLYVWGGTVVILRVLVLCR